MPRPILRVNLASDSRDFQRVAVQPGFPMLDKSGSNAKTLGRWLGPLIAESKWDGENVLFFAKDDDGSMPESAPCQPATAAELRGRLRADLEQLQERLREAKPATPNEASLHRSTTAQLENQLEKLDVHDPSPHFFRVKPPSGKVRLAWCCGYEQKPSESTAAVICPNSECGMLSMGPTPTGECPGCGTALGRQREFPKLAAAILLLLLIGGGIAGVWFLMNREKPEAVAKEEKEVPAVVHYSLQGRVIDQQSGSPVAGAVVAISGIPRTTSADEKGEFRFEKIVNQTVEIEVSSSGYVPQTLKQQLTAEGSDAEKIEVPLQGNAVLFGRVFDGLDQVPVVNATVSIGDPPVKTQTDKEGAFRVEGLRGGMPASVEVSATGYEDGKADVMLVEDDQVESLVALTGNAVLTGSVQVAGTETPVAGAKISLVGSARRVTADQKGQFKLARVRGGKAEIEVAADGYASVRQQVELKPAAENPVNVELQGQAILVGKVIDAATNQGIPAVQVSVAGTTLKTLTDEAGTFRIEGCRIGSAKIEVNADGYPPESVEARLATEKPTETLVKLVGAGLIFGKVVDSVTDLPVAGATVEVNARQEKTDKEGKFRIDRTRQGEVDIEIQASGYLAQQLSRKLAADKGTELLVRLAGDAVLAGQVLEAGSKIPIQNAEVTIDDSQRVIKTDSQGRFKLEGSRSGPAKLSVAAKGYLTQKSETQLVSAKEIALLVELSKKPATTEIPTTPAEDLPLVEFFGVKARAGSVGFVVDCSGSMAGNRIRRTKAELATSIIDLNSQQRFFVSFFNGSAVPMQGGSPVDATPLEKVRAYDWMKTVTANGGTNPEPALQLVGKMKPHVIFLLSDGEFSELGKETLELFKQHKIVVNTIAFEDEGGAERLKAIARATGGFYRFVPEGELPANFELMIDTRLAMLLIDALDDPDPSDPQQYRRALIEYCNQEDLGPGPNASATDVQKSMDDWVSWWVQYKLVPYDKTIDEAGLLAEMRHPTDVRRWAAVEAARQRKLDVPSDYIVALHDNDPRVRRAAHLALVGIAGRDYGKVGGEDKAERDKSINLWKGWLSRRKLIAGIPKLADAALQIRFADPQNDIRVAALREAGKRRLRNPDKYIAALGDDDDSVRNAAHEALVLSLDGKVDFGPSPAADPSQRAASVRKWQAWRNEQIEQKAQLELRQAKTLLKKKDKETAKAVFQRLQKIIKDYPATQAAKEASRILKTGK